MTDRPNILFISSDSMDGRVLGCMGHTAAYTPHMDRLASRGVLFTQAYCNSPQCCPSRASMWSGRYVHQVQAWNNHKGLEEGDCTFQDRLEAGSYRTHIIGKTDYLSGYHSLGARVTAWADPVGLQVTGLAARPQAVVVGEPHHDWRSIDASLAWLDAHAAEDDAPFFLYCGLNLPHPPFRTTQEWLDKIDPVRVTVPPYEAEPHPVMDYMRVRKGCVGEFSDEELVAIRRTYYAMVAELDAMVGALVDKIDALGLAGSTHIIYLSDHGEMNMEHRMHLKNALYEGSARVPIMVAGPGIASGGRVESLVSLADVYPTLMDLAGLSQPEGLAGYSLLPEIEGGAHPDRPDEVFSEYHSNFQNTSSFMLRRGEYKYVAYAGYEPQLFHLGEDPEEMHDLVAERPGVAAEMAAGLRAIVDHDAVARDVLAYNRAAFRAWRDSMEPAAYHEAMARFFRGWGPEQQCIVDDWLAQG